MTTIAHNGSDLEQLVGETRQRLRRNAVMTGATLVVASAVGWLVLSAVVDLLVPLPVPLRIVLGSAFWLILIGSLLAAVAWPAMQPLGLDRVALRIERTVPGMHNRLITVLDVRRRAAGSDDAFVERLIEQTRARLGAYEIEDVASRRPLRYGVIAAVAAVIAAIVLLAAIGEPMTTAVARIVRPTAAIAPVSWVKLTALSGDLDVLQGDAAVIGASVDRGEVDFLRCRLRPAGGKWISYPMEPGGAGRFTFTLSEVSQSYEYQIRGGRTWTATHRITMLRRPVIKTLGAVVRLPSYMKIDDLQPIDEHAETIAAPTGSRLEFNVQIEGDASNGQIMLYGPQDVSSEADAEAETEQVETELVWFDDDWPIDAELTGNARWITDRTYSGTRAHTFDWSREPYGFATRLNKLAAPPDASFFVYVWLDPADPPGQLTIDLAYDGGSHSLVWRTDADSEQAKAKPVAFDPLPEPGQWVRLQVPIGELPRGDKDSPAQLSGITFQVDTGLAYFDRAGVVQSLTEAILEAGDEPVEVITMGFDESTGRWTGGVSIKGDGSFSLQFRNSLNVASRPMAPRSILATEDQRPEVFLVKPGTDVTINVAQPVPLEIRALDDYGIRSVAIQTGMSPDDLGQLRELASHDQPRGERRVVSALDPVAHKLTPGNTLYYRVVAYDFGRQASASETLKLTLTKQTDDAADADQAPLKKLMDGIEALVGEQGKFVGTAGELIGEVAPDGYVSQIQPQGTIKLLNPDGTPMTAEQIQKLLSGNWAQLTAEQAEQFNALNERLGKQELTLRALSSELNAAAEAAQLSPTSMADEAEMLKLMAERADDLTGLFEQMRNGENVADALAESQEMLPFLQSGFGELQQQLQEMMEARQMLGEDPTAAHQRMESLMSLSQTKDAQQALEELRQSLEGQQQAIGQMQSQLEALQAQVQDADVSELDELSQKQQDLDIEAIKRMLEAQALMQNMPMDQLDANEMQRPWTPPGRRATSMPVEQDTPEEGPQPPRADAAAADRDADEQEEPVDWWDQPVQLEQPGWTTQDSDRFADRQRSVDTPAPREATGRRSPREMLQEHQDEFQQQLSQNSSDLAAYSTQAQQMADQLQAVAAQMQQQSNSRMPSASRQPGAMSPMQQFQQMMGSSQMQQMMGMSQRARLLGSMRSMSGGMMLNRVAPPRRGTAIYLDLGNLPLSASQRAAVYRLPPRLREPLIQGMAERGPEGYQHLIDAYYQRIGQEME